MTGLRRILDQRGPARCLIAAAVWYATAFPASWAHAAPAASPWADVMLRADGSLDGLVISAAAQTASQKPAAMRVELLRAGRVVAETATDAQGRFVLRNLAPGPYQIVVDTPWGATGRFYRVWTASAAPPGAARSVRARVGGPVRRGQGPFPPTRFPKAATLTLIAVGAIAAPIIYHNTKREPLVPASP